MTIEIICHTSLIIIKIIHEDNEDPFCKRTLLLEITYIIYGASTLMITVRFGVRVLKCQEAARVKCWLPLGKFACMLEEGIALKERNARSFLIGPLRNKDFVGDDGIRELCPVINVVVTGDFS